MDQMRVQFMKGVLAALASTGQVVTYDEIRRLCRLAQEQCGEYLGEARKAMVGAGQPDFCAVVVGASGTPGSGWGSADEWAQALRQAHEFWSDRRRMDNAEFRDKYGALPVEPGLPAER
ncbi:MAG: hypothetical protein R3B72_51220 [Polyangiaceae bacterium]